MALVVNLQIVWELLRDFAQRGTPLIANVLLELFFILLFISSASSFSR
jgi:hypothetical protein